MYFTTHLLAGGAVGTAFPQPAAGFAAGVFSHLALDMVPHHDYQDAKLGAVDIFLGLLLAGLLLKVGMGPSAFWGAIGGTIPDLEVLCSHFPPERPKLKRNFFPTHNGLLCHPHLGLPWGAMIQMLVAVISLLFLLH